MKNNLIIGVIAVTLSTNMLVPSITAYASQNRISVKQNDAIELEGEISEDKIQFMTSSIDEEEVTKDEYNMIEPRGFSWAKSLIKVKDWTKGSSQRVKKWVGTAGVVITIADTIKIAIDWIRAITIKTEYVGPGYYTSGDPVKTVQKALNERGFSAGAEDGIYGTNTKNAIKKFQQSKSLVADGIVGPSTWKLLLEK